MRPLFRTLDDCPFTFIRIYTLSHTSGQYGPTNAKHSNTDLSTLYRQQRLLCRGIVREQKRQCVRERRKERITERNFSFCHRLMHDAKPGCKGKPAVGRSVPEHLLRALPPTPMELISYFILQFSDWIVKKCLKHIHNVPAHLMKVTHCSQSRRKSTLTHVYTLSLD